MQTEFKIHLAHKSEKVPTYHCSLLLQVYEFVFLCRSKEKKMERVNELFAIKLNGHSAVSIQLELH